MPNPSGRPFFLPAARGQRFCIHHRPPGAVRSAVLYVHPWAEEMNKARRMAALQSRALAAAGHAVLQMDLEGCGDSSGDFADAGWERWLDDLALGVRWLHGQHAAPLWLWGLRAGALLATQAAERVEGGCRLLLWQPAASGKQLLQQFLRLKAAAGLQQGDAKGALERTREELAAGQCVEIAGYRLPPQLAQGLEAASLQRPANCPRVVWLEVSTRDPATLLPASDSRIGQWRTTGLAVHAEAVKGPAFWQTQEIEDAPALLSATTAALDAA